MPPHFTEQDVEYVLATFEPQAEADRERAASGVAPNPSYVLPDGRSMISAEPDPDLAQASDSKDLRRRFIARWTTAGGREDDAGTEIAAWLDGGYGVCLRSPGPESILVKEGIARAITALIARPEPQQAWWRATLRHSVAAYDQLVLPFASIDAARFGGATSRARLVDAVRARWPEVFSHASDASGGASPAAMLPP